MKLAIYQIDAFTNEVFKGNYAAVIPLENWLPDALMQSIAAENNLSETAFFVRNAEGSYEIRWFSPLAEIDFCGHATLASAYADFSNRTASCLRSHFAAQGSRQPVGHPVAGRGYRDEFSATQPGTDWQQYRPACSKGCRSGRNRS